MHCKGCACAVLHMSSALRPRLMLSSLPFLQGTGIVTSVPSDAPDDYAALMDLGKAAFSCETVKMRVRPSL